jgi:hypothetical protein
MVDVLSLGLKSKKVVAEAMVAKLGRDCCVCLDTSSRCLWDESATVDRCLESGEALCATSRCGNCLQGGATRTFRSGAVQDVRRIVSHVNQILQGLAVKVLDWSRLTYHSCFYFYAEVPLYPVSHEVPCRVEASGS